MVAIIRCPHCAQSVAVPESALPTSDVRCPHCEAEYPLGEPAVDSVPELIVVRGGAEPLPQHEAAFSAHGAGPSTPVESDSDDSPGIDFAPAEGPDSPSHADAPSHEEVAWGTDHGESAESDEGAIGEDDDDGSDTSVAAARPRKAPKKRRGPGPLGHLIGIVLSGILGLVIGYFILRFFFPKNDALISLEQKIAPYAPWLVRAHPSPEPDGAGNGSPAAAEKKLPKEAPRPPIAVTPVQPAPEPPKPEPAPPMEVRFSGRLTAESVTPKEFETALAAASAALAKSPKVITPEQYMSICDLGNAAALLEDSGERSNGLRRSAEELLTKASAPDRHSRIESFAGQWLFSGKRAADRPGVWLVGRVEKVGTLKTPQGNLTETVLTLQGKETARRISVVSHQPPELHEGNTAGVLGTIVTDPKQRLPWYTGDEPLVILSGVAVSLSQ